MPGKHAPPDERFWSKVDVRDSDECWEWTASVNQYGYGRFWDGTSYMGAHRFSWRLHNGKIPDGLFVLHSCDNPACVNPNHLFLGTQADNLRDMIRKGRRGYTGLRGVKNPKAKLMPKQVYEIRALLSSGETRAEVARRFGLSWTTVDKIMHRDHWSHLEEDY